MAEIPPNISIDLRTLIFYNIYQQKTIEKSYENYEKLCSAIGKLPFSFEKFMNFFHLCSKKSLSRQAFMNLKKLRSYLIFRDLDIRLCVLSDVINEKSTEKSIKDLRKVFGKETIEKDDHDYWSERFKNSSPPFNLLTFSDLPIEIVMRFVERFDIAEMCVRRSFENLLKSLIFFSRQLRNVSHGLQKILDEEVKPPCKKIQINIRDPGFFVEYRDNFYLEMKIEAVEKKERERKEEIKVEDVAILFKEVSPELKNPKLRLNFLFIDLLYDYSTVSGHWLWNSHPEFNEARQKRIDDFKGFLASMNHKIHSTFLTMTASNVEDVTTVLRCLKSGILRKITLTIEQESKSTLNIDEMAATDQWKQAKHVTINKLISSSIEHFYHFGTFDIRVQEISIEEIVKLVDALSKSPDFTACTIYKRNCLDTEALKRTLNLENHDSLQTYPIPNSNLFINFFSGIKITQGEEDPCSLTL
ncbi:hypothetical protein CRE_11100 [Caenorhabditis remanei]|uniref:DUF38 domain-containing protein n=1 Tax=Caenorhabditis remanei TaxID=31234 RepID=E3M5J8_CAERE|nr:hypothetical protein CRE_11100 [Caenorhabditis remanei]